MLKFTTEMQSQWDRSHPSPLQNWRGIIPSVNEDAAQISNTTLMLLEEA